MDYNEHMLENRKIDIRTIDENGPKISFKATAAERQALAERFDIPAIYKLEVNGTFGYDDLITFDGEMRVSAQRECVVTLKPFTEETTNAIHLLFSENQKDTDNPEEDILPIHKGKIDLFDVFSEEFGLALNPFPKSVDTYLDYHDKENEKENPFAVLKNFKKED